MPEPTQAVATLDKESVFVPFGSKDEIKLSINIVKRLVAVKTKSGQTCTDDDAMKFIMMCKARALNPFEGDAFLIGYDSNQGAKFSLITAHQAFLKRAELNQEYDGMESGVIVELEEGKLKDLEGDFHKPDQKVVGGWAVVYFKHRKFPMRKRVRLSRFQKSFGIWQDDPAGMIVKCAEADALRSSFPTMLGGLYLREEMEHEATVVASAPIFKDEPAPRAMLEKAAEAVALEVVEPAKAPPQAATVPLVPVPEPKKVKTPPPPPTPVKPSQEPKMLSILEVVRQRLGEAEVTPEKAVRFLFDNDQIPDGAVTLQQVSLESPEALDFLYNNFDDIIERIKS